jgi:hypothetical protein
MTTNCLRCAAEAWVREPSKHHLRALVAARFRAGLAPITGVLLEDPNRLVPVLHIALFFGDRTELRTRGPLDLELGFELCREAASQVRDDVRRALEGYEPGA